MTGSAYQAMDVVSVLRKLSSEESAERRWQSDFDPAQGWRIAPNAIYIYTQTQLFGIPNLECFWRGFGEVLERILETKSSKNIVFYNGF